MAHHPRVAAHAARHGGPIARRTGAALKRQDSRNDTLASLAGHLLWHGVDPVVALDLLLARNAFRCRPPLSEDEVARAVDSIAPARAARRRPRVSTSGRETRCGSGLARDQRR
ncbi:MAG: primase C-terminal domain-containing protein [Betaproteobacteria bacterium]|nr:primase C-terminal domain-containing protein [Betaproteobacteria bacterium]